MHKLLLIFLFTSGICHAQQEPLTTNVNENVDQELSPDSTSYNKQLKNRYSLFLHKRTFLLPFTYNWKTHQELYSGLPGLAPKGEPFYQNEEAQFQISFFIPAYREVLGSDWDLLFAYTHQAWWQLYNSTWSKPFRETNYMPELFFRKVNKDPLKMSLFDAVAFDLGMVHQSNGQIQLVSRSWDRVFARAYFVNPTVSLSIAVWARIPERPHEDQNRNILRYMGHGEITALKTFGIHTVEVKMPFSERPGLEVHYSYPWYGNLRLFVMGNIGYGHSLIEYNKETQRIGMGITLESFIDRKKKEPVPMQR
ncbi:MAG: phospholipase A [Bdellovibrionaceae bacterium]|nr:phospholipase A [Pseudobdellovibrionaceae bacterium]